MTIAVLPSLIGLAFPVKRSGPIFDTNVQRSLSGRRTAFGNRVTPLWRWELSFDVLRPNSGDMAQLAAFFAARGGQATTFGYRDAEDNTASAQGFGVGNGTTATFQLVRAFGGYTEPVLVTDGSPTIMVGGAVKVAGTDYTLGDFGKVTFTTPPAAGAALTWSGGFLWLCAFDDDSIDFTNFASGFWSVDRLAFTSVIP